MTDSPRKFNSSKHYATGLTLSLDFAKECFNVLSHNCLSSSLPFFRTLVKMANFDTNSWYQITRQSATQSMIGTIPFSNGTGAVFFQVTNTTLPAQQWQFFPYNSTYYVLRTKDSSSIGYLGVAASNNSGVAGNTVPDIRNYTLSDNGMFWTIEPWGDGTFFFTNAANGTAWHLNSKNIHFLCLTYRERYFKTARSSFPVKDWRCRC